MARDRRSDIGRMHAALRCGARTRDGRPCRAPAVHGRRRCRMHGGARGAGAPEGNRNALKHGAYTADTIAERRAVRMLIRRVLGVPGEGGA